MRENKEQKHKILSGRFEPTLPLCPFRKGLLRIQNQLELYSPEAGCTLPNILFVIAILCKTPPEGVLLL